MTSSTNSSIAEIRSLSASPEIDPPIKLVRKLCLKLNATGIAYVHWKSNAMIDRSASGENDLDLLVGKADIQRFTQILSMLGFIRANAPPDKQIPGIENFYGYDEPANTFVHVHSHYHLIIGHDMTKNYHLPIETAYLESAQQHRFFKLPTPEFELIIFVIRMMLKHWTWDAVVNGQRKLSNNEHNELIYLTNLSSEANIIELLKRHLPVLAPDFFLRCLDMMNREGMIMNRIVAASRLQHYLRSYARKPYALDVWLKFSTRLRWGIKRRIDAHFGKKAIGSGGLMIAIIGGDGAGKTTIVNALGEWLSEIFRTNKIHMGKPQWSRTTIIVRGIIKIGRSLGFYPFMKAPMTYHADRKDTVFPGYPWLIREICTARDRLLTYKCAIRFLATGGIVISDRFPLREVKFMDGPQAERMLVNCDTNWLLRTLIKMEKKYYLAIRPPELSIVIRTAPETAVSRRSDEDKTAVRARSTEIWNFFWNPQTFYVVDGNKPKATIISELKNIVWSCL